MKFLSARGILPACIISAVSVAALAAPGVASALPKTDKGAKCSGSSIEGLGSTFQDHAQQVWTGLKSPAKGFDESLVGCEGKAGAPTVIYNQEETPVNHQGSGACLKDFGVEHTASYKAFPYCGTDEAPNPTAINEIEKNAHTELGYEGRSLETIPVAQSAESIVVHLPTGCVAQSEPELSGKVTKLGRLVLDASTIEGIYRGTIKTWEEVDTAQGVEHGKDAITCKTGVKGETEAEKIQATKEGLEKTIRPVVRLDKSGTTHIFKEYLAEVNTGEWEAEEFNEPENGTKPKCGVIKPAGEKVTWAQVGEGCENQRWPEAANVLRPVVPRTGNKGVLTTVNETESSIGYSDIGYAREEGFFSKKCPVTKPATKPPLCSGENKKGTETTVGEQNTKFWAEVQNTEPGKTPITYTDPASNGDVEKAANANCAGTIYIAKHGETFPPKSTRETWYAAKAQLAQKKYSICGLTYDLALRQYYYFLSPEGVTAENSINIATTVGNYLEYVLSTKTEGGGKELKNHDYEAVPSTVLKEAQLGAQEIGSKLG